MERPMSGASRPGTAASRSAWGDNNLYDDDPENAKKMPTVFGEQDDTPVAMESEVFDKSGQVRVQQRHKQQKDEPKGCWYGFKKGIRSIWMTKHTEDTKFDRDMYIRTTLRELIIYLIFLIDLCILTFGMTGVSMYYFTKVMTELFLNSPTVTLKTFGGLSSMQDFWDVSVYLDYGYACVLSFTFGMTSPTMYYYTKVMRELFLDTSFSQTSNNYKGMTQMIDFWRFSEGPLVDGLYWEEWYNGWNVTSDALGYIYYENKLLGVPRMRMLRVKSDSCVVPDAFEKEIKDCYDTYASGIEDKNVFGDGLNGNNGTAWRYQSEKDLDGSSYWGKISTYGGGGFVQDLAVTKADTLRQMANLKTNRWIDRGTRAVFLDFTVYNANINLFCVIKLIMEFPATGGVLTSWSFRTVKLIRYVTAFDYFVLACEGLFAVFIVYYIIEESIEIKKHRCSYFKTFWNWLDVLVIMIAMCCIAFSVYRTIVVDKKLNSLLENQDQYANFEFLSFAQTRFNDAVAVMVFFAWVKIFKYISFNKTMNQLSSTLSRCAKDVGGFAIMFFIFFFAYAQLGYLIFGTQVKDFSTFYDAVFTLLRTILGDFDFHELEQANRVLGPIFFITYVFFVFFILLNMFLAIINDTYAEVKAELATQRNEFELGDYFKRGYHNMLRKMNLKKDRIVDIQHALNQSDANTDKQVDFDEWRQQLKQRGYAEQEIEAMFARYDMDGDHVLDEEEQRQMKENLNEQQASLDSEMKDGRPGTARSTFTDFGEDEAMASAAMRNRRGPGGFGGGASFDEFQALQRRVDRMEHSIGSIVSKIDAVLVKLDAMEKIKQRHQEEMKKIMNQINDTDATDSDKRQQMEDLVKDELDRFDKDSGSRPASGITK